MRTRLIVVMSVVLAMSSSPGAATAHQAKQPVLPRAPSRTACRWRTYKPPIMALPCADAPMYSARLHLNWLKWNHHAALAKGHALVQHGGQQVDTAVLVRATHPASRSCGVFYTHLYIRYAQPVPRPAHQVEHKRLEPNC